MNKKTLKALKESIQSWKTKKIRTRTDIGSTVCPLCWLYIELQCDGCPVNKASGNKCRNTPWIKLCDYLTDFSYNKDPKIIEQYRKEEVDFLISLLPEGETV